MLTFLKSLREEGNSLDRKAPGEVMCSWVCPCSWECPWSFVPFTGSNYTHKFLNTLFTVKKKFMNKINHKTFLMNINIPQKLKFHIQYQLLFFSHLLLTLILAQAQNAILAESSIQIFIYVFFGIGINFFNCLKFLIIF